MPWWGVTKFSTCNFDDDFQSCKDRLRWSKIHFFSCYGPILPSLRFILSVNIDPNSKTLYIFVLFKLWVMVYFHLFLFLQKSFFELFEQVLWYVFQTKKSIKDLRNIRSPSVIRKAPFYFPGQTNYGLYRILHRIRILSIILFI